MQKIDISNHELILVKQILEKYVPEYEVQVFGSRVRGRTEKNSDLDLVIMTDKPLPVLTLADLKEAFSESDLPFRVDVVDWACTKESFRKIIEKQAVRIR